MCGISGYFNYDGGATIPLDLVTKMQNALSHRGPDSSGSFVNDSIALMHNRLSILDLSSSGNQPFHSASGRYIISYNGEVYNFKELAKKYKIETRTNTDTEVIVELFSILGINAFNHLNGMFAFAIYDQLEKKLYLVRDRMGIKPLYYFNNNSFLAFASELKGLLKLDAIKNSVTLNHSAVYSFLHLGYVPDTNSIYNEIKKVQPGTVIEIQKSGITTHQFWNLNNIIAPKEKYLDFNKAKTKFSDIIKSSVTNRLISDAPLGIFMSGGIDSSLIAAIARKHHEGPLKTFTIGYKEDKHNEIPFAKKVADYIGTEHHELLLEEKDVIEKIDKLLYHFDEPFADSSCLPTYFISEYASHSVKTVLAGEGSDELFMGYGVYNWPYRLRKAGAARKIIGEALSFSSDNRYRKSSLMFSHYNSQNPFSHIYSQEQGYFSTKELSDLLIGISGKNLTDSIPNDIAHLNRILQPEEAQAFFDLKYSITGDLLTKVDRASMNCSLEVREPFLDYRLIEFSINLPLKHKLKNSVTKYIVKELLYDYIPKQYFDRQKQGFSIPLEKWMQGELKYLIDSFLSKEAIEETGFLNYSVVSKLKNRFFQGETFLYNRLWVLIVLQKWIKSNNH